jgi:hypothetical protein
LAELDREVPTSYEGNRNGNNKIMTILVGNKCDIVGKREVQEEEAAAFAKERNLLYI